MPWLEPLGSCFETPLKMAVHRKQVRLCNGNAIYYCFFIQAFIKNKAKTNPTLLVVYVPAGRTVM